MVALDPENMDRPLGGIRLFHQKSTCIMQLTLGRYVVQIWSRRPQNFEATKPSNSTEWYVHDRKRRFRCIGLFHAGAIGRQITAGSTRNFNRLWCYRTGVFCCLDVYHRSPDPGER